MTPHADPNRSPVVLSLGSNLGNRLATLESARAYLVAGGVVRVLRVSSVYETEPVQCRAQRWFLNQVVLVETALPTLLLLSFCQRVEALHGRRRPEWHGPRILDMDILFVGGLCIKTPVLTLPHPAIPRRRSILLPLAELGTGWRHPVLGAEVPELLARCPDHSRVVKVGSGGDDG